LRKGFLIRQTEGVDGDRLPLGEVFLIGRIPECNLVIEDPAASRRHVEITMRDEAFYWRDLGSTNGTKINGVKMLDGELSPGDIIGIGDVQLRFETEEIEVEEIQDSPTPSPIPSPIPSDEPPVFSGTLLGDYGEDSVQDAGKSEVLLRAVYNVMNEIASNYELCSLVDRILEMTTSAIHAQRGALFFAKGACEALLPCLTCGHVHAIRDTQLEHGTIGDFRISNTVARRVLENGESILLGENADDEEVYTAESVVSLKLRSILCVPLRAKSGILGILYFDTNRPSHQYTQDDLLLAAAMGASAGLAIENANMHQQLLEKQRMEQEIAHAWTIQEGFLLTEWPATGDRFEVYGETRPAKTVGGDFYDFVQLDKGRVGLLIGDVSGKGIPAALTMAQLLSRFRMCARDLTSPTEVIRVLNDDLVIRSKHGMFCTVCYAILDLSTGIVVCANAGHPPPVHINMAGVPQCFDLASGPPLGISANAQWEDAKRHMTPGDVLLLYTDGIVEARTPEKKEEFDIEGLCRVLKDQQGRPPKDLVEYVNGHVSEHCRPALPHDDCTMIAVRYLG